MEIVHILVAIMKVRDTNDVKLELIRNIWNKMMKHCLKWVETRLDLVEITLDVMEPLALVGETYAGESLSFIVKKDYGNE